MVCLTGVALHWQILRAVCKQQQTENYMKKDKKWAFVHHEENHATWASGLRNIFEYRDLGVKAATNGDYVAHVIRRNKNENDDGIQSWHIHECEFQLVYVLNGWATFEYEGQGQRTIRKGDTVLQTPMIKHREVACSDDFEVLEIVSPANFKTRVVEPPVPSGNVS
jgi:mannose-6-phosphate isomerase-like protein (cupin superfamily)